MSVGLVLSGGGIRGAAHIGVIKALEEFGVYPTRISGTSAGAIVGALYAAGNNCSQMLSFFKATSIFSTNKYAFNKPGLIDSEKFVEELENYIPENDFANLKKILYVSATNVLTGKLKIFNSGELIKPVLASASFPGVFTPVKIKSSFYIDGGVLNNFPVEPLKKECDVIIGVYVNPLKAITSKDLKHAYNVLDRAYKIMSASSSISKFSECDLVISPEQLIDFGTFNMKNVDVIYNIAYQATKEKLKESNLL